MKSQTLIFGAVLMLFSFAGFSCSRYDTNPAEVPDPDNDEVVAESPSGASDGTETTTASTGDTNEQARQVVLAGGCFWCVEAVYEQLDGVLDVESGYAGGDVLTANYKAVGSGRTKHAEVVRITYDPTKITYGTILKVFFTTAHDPTTLNRQGADVGPQYRSAIFYANDEQKQIAAEYIKQLNEAGVYRDPIVTTLEPLDAYYPAEGYHQDYASQNPGNPYIQGVSQPKVDKTRKVYTDLLKGTSDAE
ncbi:MAG: peptide-methionine (S)-S-oxide reductase MsrA [Phycisphaeraceae bacterium]|nr:peptide-methionine (S)-S-oxide reductase MsrA [Phycisphaeraceae bacterium]